MAAFDYMDGRPAVNDEIWDATEQLHLVRRWGLRHNASPFTTSGRCWSGWPVKIVGGT